MTSMQPPREGPTTQPQKPEVQTIELTSKRFKAGQLLGCLMMILAILALILGLTRMDTEGTAGPILLFFAVVLLVGGLGLSILMRTLIWWHHR